MRRSYYSLISLGMVLLIVTASGCGIAFESSRPDRPSLVSASKSKSSHLPKRRETPAHPSVHVQDDARDILPVADQGHGKWSDAVLLADASPTAPPTEDSGAFSFTRAANNVFFTVREDHKNYYSWTGLLKVAGGLAVAAPIANTRFDEDIHEWIQEDVRSSGSDDFSDVTKAFGEYTIALPVFVGTALLDSALGVTVGEVPGSSVLSEWGQRSLRSLIVGVPPVLLCQVILGSPRPEEGHSNWDAFEDNNGCSGHAFVGALPFLTAASMTDNWWLKPAWFLGSFATGFSRLNDGDHYFSQVALGWWLAHIAVSSVTQTEEEKGPVQIMPAFFPGDPEAVGVGLAVQF